MNLRRILFLALGLWYIDPPVRPDKRKAAKESLEKLVEPDGARACRRNIMALASAVVIAGLMGAGPLDIDLLGIKPSGQREVFIVGILTMLAHIYWYVQRYLHLMDDGKIEQDPSSNLTNTGHLKINWNPNFRLLRRKHDVIANYVAFIMTIFSWIVIFSWFY